MLDNQDNINNKKHKLNYLKTISEILEIDTQRLTINGGDLLKKFKSREDRYNFLREMFQKMANLWIYFIKLKAEDIIKVEKQDKSKLQIEIKALHKLNWAEEKI